MSEDFFAYPAQDTDPNFHIPPRGELALQAGVDPRLLERIPLHEYDVPVEGIVLDPRTMRDMDGSGLLGIVQVGESAVKIYDSPLGSESALPMFYVASPTYRPTEEVDGNAAPLNFAAAYPGSPLAVGRQTSVANRLGLKEDMQVSREHFAVSATPDGKLIITDLGSANGTRFIAAERETTRPVAERTARVIGEAATLDIVERPAVAEKDFGGITVQLNGRFIEGNYNGYVLTTIDTDGTSRKMFAYKSQSEGGWRISPGIELVRTDRGTVRHYMKGASQDASYQYTQDSQIHPAVLAAFEGWVHTAGDSIPVIDDTDVVLEEPEAEVVVKDFMSARRVEPMPDAKAAQALAQCQAGALGKEDLARAFGVPEDQVGERLKEYVEQLNVDLERGGLLPDFHRPVWRGREDHPRLGGVVREVFVHSVQGRKYEWDMVTDSQGRVWIDRIRDVAAHPNAYGGDDVMVLSGILTSKPMDYKGQTLGLPSEYRETVDARYIDITRFLDTLAPIKRYREQRQIARK